MRDMQLAFVAFALFPLLGVGADPKPGDEGTPEFETATELVKQLGDKRFLTREAASKQLIEMGFAAVPALRIGTLSTDAEVRARCTTLIPAAKTAEWNRRTDAYLADIHGKQKHNLPLLAEWEKLTGPPDAGSRKLFAAMIRNEGEFLDAAAANLKKAFRVCAAKCKTILERVQGPKGQARAEPLELFALLFVDTLDPVWLGLPNPGVPSDLLRNPGVAEAIAAAETGPSVRRLLVKWADSRLPNDPVQPLFEFAELARRQPFPEATPILAELAKDRTARSFCKRLVAIEALGACGGEQAAATLAEMVEDGEILFVRASISGRPKPRYSDQALAALLKLHGKKAEDFGLQTVKSSMVRPSGSEYTPMTIYEFASHEERDDAIQKWKNEEAKIRRDKK